MRSARHVIDTFEAQQQTEVLIFRGNDALDSPEALVEDGRIKELLATVRRCFAATRVLRNVRRYATIENPTAVGAAFLSLAWVVPAL